jgi:SAM-dependent methyltransferase
MAAFGQGPHGAPVDRHARAGRGTGIYATTWDDYVERWTPVEGAGEWPGDEWGYAELWEEIFQTVFVPAGVAAWSRAVEIGPGSGKYTVKVFSASTCVVRGYDVSARYLDVCEARCADWIGSGRLSLHLIAGARADELVGDLDDAGWTRSVDALYSIDAMVHVDLQYLMVYLITAGLVLKPGGKLILTLADVTRDPGFVHLLNDIMWTYPIQGQPSGKFEWLSPDIVRSVLARLGFEVDSLTDTQRDLHLVASLRDPERADDLRRFLSPPQAGA